MPVRHPSFLIVAAIGLTGCSYFQSAPTPPVHAAEAPQAAAAAVAAPKDQGWNAEKAKVIADNRIDVPFEEGSAALGPDADKKLDAAARLFRDAGPAVMFSTGCTDASGEEYNNLLLSARRAQTVKKALADRGIPPSRIQLRAYGASDPVDPANPAAPSNRRVIVTWRMA